MFAAAPLVGSGMPLRTRDANGVIGIGVPAGYTAPVSGLRTGTVRTPCRWAGVGTVKKATVSRVWRKPS